MDEEPSPWDCETGAWHVLFRLVPYERPHVRNDQEQELSLFDQARDPEWGVVMESRLL
ncbi:MAG: hypothetical protein HQL50_11145 [Magnetococcales bacterium]|nr:hypothetical protein [Magnetococcales bacterium]